MVVKNRHKAKTGKKRENKENRQIGFTYLCALTLKWVLWVTRIAHLMSTYILTAL